MCQWAPIALRRVNQLPAETLAAGSTRRPTSRSVLDLSFGDPDLASPPVAVDTLAVAAIDRANHHYAPDAGCVQARTALARWYQHRFGVYVDPDSEVLVTVGAKQALAQLLTVADGDTVVVPTPPTPATATPRAWLAPTPSRYPSPTPTISCTESNRSATRNGLGCWWCRFRTTRPGPSWILCGGSGW